MAPALVFLLAILSLFASSATAAIQSTSGCISGFDPTVNYFPDAFANETFALPLGQTVVTNAQDFTVQYGNSYKVVHNSFAQTTYVAYQCGAPKPTGFSNLTTRFFQIPLSNVVLDSTVPMGFVELLGLLPYIKVADGFYTVAPCAQKLLASGVIAAYNFSATYSQPWVSASQIYTLQPNVVSFDATTDPGPLKRAEWIKYLALFFNAEARAAQVFSQIETSYKCLKASGANSTAGGKAPVVAWLSYYGGNWTVSNAAYKLQFVADANGTSLDSALLTQYNMSLPDSAKAFQSLLKTVDIVMDETYLPSGPSAYSVKNITTNAGIAASDESEYPFLKTGSVWSIYGRSNGPPNQGVDWFEGAVAQPQLVLNDLINILYPTATSASPFYFYNVAKGKPSPDVTPASCTGSIYSAVEPIIPQCTIQASSTTSSPASSNSSAPAPSPAKSAGNLIGSTFVSMASIAAIVTAALFV